MTELEKCCQFKRGQVWENPDGEIMMVTFVKSKFNNNGFTVFYVSQDGEKGSFTDKDSHIINNIKAATAYSEMARVEREKLATFMLDNGIATGHGDTIDDLLIELGGFIKEQRGLIGGVPQWQPKEKFERDGTEVIAWLSSNKGFQDITARLIFIDNDTGAGWIWGDSEDPVKRPDLINGVMPWPEPPTAAEKE